MQSGMSVYTSGKLVLSEKKSNSPPPIVSINKAIAALRKTCNPFTIYMKNNKKAGLQ